MFRNPFTPRLPGALLILAAAGCTPSAAFAKGRTPPPPAPGPVTVRAVLGTPLVPAGQKNTAFLKVGLEGLATVAQRKRPPANVAIVLDRSSSMAGDKIEAARTAAIMALASLGPDDVVSVVTYDDEVELLFPAQPLRDREALTETIRAITPRGSTALFAGVSVGAAEVRRHLDTERVNRVILLSDGQANVGPSSPGELAQLGQSLGREGIAVSTIGLGLGYNEDLMAQLARASDGNHAFVEEPSALAKIFAAELGDVLAVVAQDVDVKLSFAPGVRPLRALGRDGIIDGSTFTTRLNQVLSGNEKVLLLELEVPATAAGQSRPVVDVEVTYAEVGAKRAGRTGASVSITGSGSAQEIDKATQQDVVVAALKLLTNEQSRLALALRDEGKVDDARRLLQDNAKALRDAKEKYKAEGLKKLEEQNRSNAENLDGDNWQRTRKGMRDEQMQLDTQRAY